MARSFGCNGSSLDTWIIEFFIFIWNTLCREMERRTSIQRRLKSQLIIFLLDALSRFQHRQLLLALWGQPVLKFILCMATFQANNTITPVWCDNLCSARILFESSSPTAKIHTNTSTHTHGASFRWNKRLIHVKPKNLIKFSTFCSRNSMELNLFHQAFGPDSAMCIDDLCHNAGGTIMWT